MKFLYVVLVCIGKKLKRVEFSNNQHTAISRDFNAELKDSPIFPMHRLFKFFNFFNVRITGLSRRLVKLVTQ